MNDIIGPGSLRKIFLMLSSAVHLLLISLDQAHLDVLHWGRWSRQFSNVNTFSINPKEYCKNVNHGYNPFPIPRKADLKSGRIVPRLNHWKSKFFFSSLMVPVLAVIGSRTSSLQNIASAGGCGLLHRRKSHAVLRAEEGAYYMNLRFDLSAIHRRSLPEKAGHFYLIVKHYVDAHGRCEQPIQWDGRSGCCFGSK